MFEGGCNAARLDLEIEQGSHYKPTNLLKSTKNHWIWVTVALYHVSISELNLFSYIQ